MVTGTAPTLPSRPNSNACGCKIATSHSFIRRRLVLRGSRSLNTMYLSLFLVVILLFQTTNNIFSLFLGYSYSSTMTTHDTWPQPPPHSNGMCGACSGLGNPQGGARRPVQQGTCKVCVMDCLWSFTYPLPLLSTWVLCLPYTLVKLCYPVGPDFL